MKAAALPSTRTIILKKQSEDTEPWHNMELVRAFIYNFLGDGSANGGDILPAKASPRFGTGNARPFSQNCWVTS